MDEEIMAGRRARRQLLQLNRKLRDAEAVARNRAGALVTVSHEMREPLNGVVGMSRLLRETVLDEEQASYVEGIETSARALLELVNDLLDASRIDAGALELLDVVFSPAHLARGVSAMLQPRAAVHDVRFTLSLAPNLPPYLRGDPGRLRQIIVNLASNALKFTAEGEVKVAISVTLKDAEAADLVIEVTDTGIGLSDKARARLTSAFAQGDATVGRLYGGSGLGLLITRRLLEAMGGGLSWDSPVYGGTCFRAVCRVTLVPEMQMTKAANTTLEGVSLLVLDRQEDARLATVNLAKLWGMSVRSARSGREALALLHEAADRGQPFDLMITETPLPDMSGEELAAKITATPSLAATRLVVQTATGMRGDAVRAQELGFAAYLPKPVPADLLRACLQQVMAADPSEPLITVHGLAEQRRTLSVLVVDDNPVNRRLATIMLERAGHKVTAAEDGLEAVEAVSASRFDAVLMDVQMPGMDGMEATRRIRATPDPAVSDVPIVALTANATNEAGRLCREAGMNDYVTKPIDGARLVAVIEQLAARAAPAA